jgi:uncharacterized protein
MNHVSESTDQVESKMSGSTKKGADTMGKADRSEGSSFRHLFRAVANGTVKEVREAMGNTDISKCRDEVGNTILHQAVTSGARSAILGMIMKSGGLVDVANDKGETPLALSAAMGNRKTVEALLAAGANVNPQDKIGRTALMNAAEAGDAGMVELLIKHGANVNAADRHQETALMMAASWGYSKVVRSLLRGGAMCETPNKGGWTALNFAQELGNGEVSKILEKFSKGGSKPSCHKSYIVPPQAAQAA